MKKSTRQSAASQDIRPNTSADTRSNRPAKPYPGQKKALHPAPVATLLLPSFFIPHPSSFGYPSSF